MRTGIPSPLARAYPCSSLTLRAWATLRARAVLRAGRQLLALAAFCAMVSACGEAPRPEPLMVVSWSGSDGAAVPLDQDLTIEFRQPLSQPLRRSSVEVLDEGGNPVVGLQPTLVGSWLRLSPQLPLSPQLHDGSLRPDHSYQIRLHGLPRLSALTSTTGSVLQAELILPFRTAAARNPAALVGNGAEFSAVRLADHVVGAPLAFSAQDPLILRFQSGLDPRTLTGVAILQTEGQEITRSCPLRLRRNSLNGAELEVLVGDWSGWGRLMLPAELEGLGGWPLMENIRTLRVHRARK